MTGPGFAPGVVEFAVAAIGIGLQDSGNSRRDALGMLARAIARVIEHRRRRILAAEGPVIADIDPASPVSVLPLASTGTVVSSPCSRSAANTWASNALEDRVQHAAAGADLIGQRRQAQRYAFTGVALGLPVQWLMLAELLKHDHRQQTGTGPAARNDMEWRRRLADVLAIAARELLAHMLDNLPLAWDDLQRLGHILAELGQARSAAAGAAGRRRDARPARAADVRGKACVRAACG